MSQVTTTQPTNTEHTSSESIKKLPPADKTSGNFNTEYNKENITVVTNENSRRPTPTILHDKTPLCEAHMDNGHSFLYNL